MDLAGNTKVGFQLGELLSGETEAYLAEVETWLKVRFDFSSGFSRDF